MAELREGVATSLIEAELRIEENTAPSSKIVRLQGVLVKVAPRVGEKI